MNRVFAKFHDMTFLYKQRSGSRVFKYKQCGCISHKDEEAYHEKIIKHLSQNKDKYSIGDVIFIGSTYETRQEYGFAIITPDGFQGGEEPPFGCVPGIYYRNTVQEINDFWLDFCGAEYYEEEEYWKDHLISNNCYE